MNTDYIANYLNSVSRIPYDQLKDRFDSCLDPIKTVLKKELSVQNYCHNSIAVLKQLETPMSCQYFLYVMTQVKCYLGANLNEASRTLEIEEFHNETSIVDELVNLHGCLLSTQLCFIKQYLQQKDPSTDTCSPSIKLLLESVVPLYLKFFSGRVDLCSVLMVQVSTVFERYLLSRGHTFYAYGLAFEYLKRYQQFCSAENGVFALKDVEYVIQTVAKSYYFDLHCSTNMVLLMSSLVNWAAFNGVVSTWKSRAGEDGKDYTVFIASLNQRGWLKECMTPSMTRQFVQLQQHFFYQIETADKYPSLNQGVFQAVESFEGAMTPINSQNRNNRGLHCHGVYQISPLVGKLPYLAYKLPSSYLTVVLFDDKLEEIVNRYALMGKCHRYVKGQFAEMTLFNRQFYICHPQFLYRFSKQGEKSVDAFSLSQLKKWVEDSAGNVMMSFDVDKTLCPSYQDSNGMKKQMTQTVKGIVDFDTVKSICSLATASLILTNGTCYRSTLNDYAKALDYAVRVSPTDELNSSFTRRARAMSTR